ncbi:CHAP domain-containing protein [Pluralibacter sp.]|uniref:CHAP domain-containing protein n=1 Tax=Pluralibacter sp. TaxID=1920032 RepID=UPI0025E67DE9|nr:CHAP domain-containing protein [Pluralibacter sp.]MBV8043726.1 CHAP domain-containing protein [Pluralibacter sp.]
MSWNKDGAISYAKTHAQPQSTGNCAHYVTKAIRNGGGLNIPNTRSAKDIGITLVNAGFRLVYDQPHAGDVAVIQSIPHHDHGHVCIYDGQQWISDFVQRSMYPGPGYRELHPHYELFRHD